MPDERGTLEDLPAGIASPALSAFRRAGYTRLEQFTTIRESELSRLHGVSAKAIGQIRVALAARGQSLAEEDRK